MRRKSKMFIKLTCSLVITGLVLYYIQSASSTEQCSKSDGDVECSTTNENEAVNRYKENNADPHKQTPENTVYLSVVACGDRLNETMVLLKSAAIFTRTYVHAIIFAEDELRPLFKEQLDAWPEEVKNRFGYTLYPIQYPADQNADEWKKLFKVCSSQRLFLPDILKDIDSVLYVDTDVLFLRPIEEVWKFFTRFNSTQISAVAPESEEPTAAWYSRFARHPYVPPHGMIPKTIYNAEDNNTKQGKGSTGHPRILAWTLVMYFIMISMMQSFNRKISCVNSGVMLMNLTRMRQAGWMSYILPYYKRHRLDITWGDQDLINIFFHYFPEKLYIFPCNWNYRPDHCMYMSNCKPAEEKGVSVLHGSRSSFQNEKQPAFKAVYKAFEEHKFDDPLDDILLSRVQKNLRESEQSRCKSVAQVFTKQLERVVRQHVRKIEGPLNKP